MKNIIVMLLSLMMSHSTLAQAPNSPDMPVINIFEISVNPDKRPQYDEIARQTISTSIDQETGTLAMYSLQRKDASHQTYMVEIYEDKEAYHRHLQSAHYQAFIARAPELINRKHQIQLTPQFLSDKHIVQNAQTINNLVIVDVKPEFQEAFKHVVLPEMAESIKVEEGVLAMYAATRVDNTHRWYFYEIYASEAAYQQHRQTPHFRDYIAQTAQMAVSKESIPVAPVYLRNKGGIGPVE
ncbi:putative quinol monooxygenase [Nissabacter archeti]|uniref:putative quinol monooxygenase n=1 Tax=Nissabacter archeti TaxID=1917880 RepID=UPI00093213E6|nr:antibiotic biosynthesis monooxygenase [Nissabacter archeti]